MSALLPTLSLSLSLTLARSLPFLYVSLSLSLSLSFLSLSLCPRCRVITKPANRFYTWEKKMSALLPTFKDVQVSRATACRGTSLIRKRPPPHMTTIGLRI